MTAAIGEDSRSQGESSARVRKVMQGNKRRDTIPELAVRRAAHALGLRYRVDVAPIPALKRRADLVFTRQKVAVFVDGCFWHCCPDHFAMPRRNTDYWTSKFDGNRRRDLETDLRLREAGWTVLRFWAHEDPDVAAGRIAQCVRAHHRCDDPFSRNDERTFATEE
jgi:DNA mismatch endonuclease (patch repair protein)